MKSLGKELEDLQVFVSKISKRNIELEKQNFKIRQLIKNKIKEQRKFNIEVLKPLMVLLERIDRGDYFIIDDKELKWRKALNQWKFKIKKDNEFLVKLKEKLK